MLALDPEHNALIVGTDAELGRGWLRTGPVNWVAGEAPAGPFRADVQIRYRVVPAPATVTPLPHGGAEARISRPLRDIAPGQAAVFYQDQICLGGGVIAESRADEETMGDDTRSLA